CGCRPCSRGCEAVPAPNQSGVGEARLSPESDEIAMTRRIRKLMIGAAIILGCVVLVGAYTRYVQASAVREWTDDSEVPTVSVITPHAGASGQNLVLPGTLSAF